MRHYYEVTFSGPGFAGLLEERTLLSKGWNTMFNFETVALVLITFCSISAAETSIDRLIAGQDNEKTIKALEDRGCGIDQMNTTRCKPIWDRMLPRPNNSNECKAIEDNFIKVQGEYSDACEGAHIKEKDCSEALVRCIESEKGDSGSDRRGSRRSADRPHDVDGAKDLYATCPSRAGEDLDKYEKQMKEQEEKVKKLEKEVPELQEKANKVMSSTTEKLTQIKVEQTDKQKKLVEDLRKLSEDKDGQEKAITDQITSIAAQVAKANDALSQVSVTKLEGQLKLKQAKVQADLNCHAQASAQVAKMQNDVTEGMKAGTFNGGGFSRQMKNIGLSDRQRWQKVANKYYKWCLDSKPTMDTKEGANDGYRLLLNQSRKSEASIREQIRQLQVQQMTLKGSACGQTTMQADGSNGGETAMCQAARKAYERSNELQKAFAADNQSLSEKYKSEQEKGNREYETYANQARKKQQEIRSETARLDNLKQLLQAKYDAGGTSNVEGKATAKAMAKRNQLKNSGIALIACKAETSPVENGEFCLNDNKCKAIYNVIVEDLKYSPKIITTTKSNGSADVAKADALKVDSRVRTNDSESLTPSPNTSNSGR